MRYIGRGVNVCTLILFGGMLAILAAHYLGVCCYCFIHAQQQCTRRPSARGEEEGGFGLLASELFVFRQKMLQSIKTCHATFKCEACCFVRIDCRSAGGCDEVRVWGFLLYAQACFGRGVFFF